VAATSRSKSHTSESRRGSALLPVPPRSSQLPLGGSSLRPLPLTPPWPPPQLPRAISPASKSRPRGEDTRPGHLQGLASMDVRASKGRARIEAITEARPGVRWFAPPTCFATAAALDTLASRPAHLLTRQCALRAFGHAGAAPPGGRHADARSCTTSAGGSSGVRLLALVATAIAESPQTTPRPPLPLL
jgi:hypothetical protein